MESEGSLPYSQQQVTSPNVQADKSESPASHLNIHLTIILSYDTIRRENHEWTYCHVSELYEHQIAFTFPSVMGVQVTNYWFWTCFDLYLIWKRHGMAHSCITILGTQLYYNSWHTAVLQFLIEVNRTAFDSQEVETNHCFFKRMCHVILVCTYRMG